MLVRLREASDDARQRKRAPCGTAACHFRSRDPNVDATSSHESTACARCGFCQHEWLRSKPL